MYLMVFMHKKYKNHDAFLHSKENLKRLYSFSGKYGRRHSKTLKKLYAKGEIINPRLGKKYPEMSLRMKLNNPMFNEDVVKKVMRANRMNGSYLIFAKLNKSKKRRQQARERQLLMNTRIFNKRPSKPQLELLDVIKAFHQDALLEFPVKCNSRIYYLDIAIPSKKLDFEYDEPYWHKDKIKDFARDLNLSLSSWKVIRIIKGDLFSHYMF